MRFELTARAKIKKAAIRFKRAVNRANKVAFRFCFPCAVFSKVIHSIKHIVSNPPGRLNPAFAVIAAALCRLCKLIIEQRIECITGRFPALNLQKRP